MSTLQSLFGEDADILQDTNFRLLLLSTLFPILGTSLVSPILESVIEPFGATTANIGLMVSVMTAPGIVLIPAAGLLSDRYGRKPVLFVSLLLFGLGGSAIALTTDFRVVLLLRGVQGVGFAGLVPVITSSIGDLFDHSAELTGQGLRMGVNGLSGATFPLLSGFLVAFAWQYPFLLYASAIPIAVLVGLFFEDPAGTTTDEPAEPEADDSYRRGMTALLKHPYVVAFLVARSLPTIVWIGFFTFNSIVIVRVLGGNAFQAGIMVAIGNLFFGLSSTQSGRIIARFDDVLTPLLLANLVMVVGFVTIFSALNMAVVLIGIVLTGVGVGIGLTMFRSIITGLAPIEFRGGLVSLSAAMARVTGTLTPIAMGGMIAIGTPIVGFADAIRLTGLGIGLVAAIGIPLILWARQYRPQPEGLRTTVEV